MAAATIRGQIVGGVIYDPVCREWAYALVVAAPGSSTKTAAGFPCGSPRRAGVGDGRHCGTGFLPELLRDTVLSNLSKLAASSNFRCAAHEYRLAAAGFCHLLLYNRLMPWDHAAGWLLPGSGGI